MKTISLHSQRNTIAFTLVELLVVISIIGLLAGMIVAIGVPAMNKAKIERVRTELKTVELAIKSYKDKKGFYPPDNPTDPAQPPLFYELSGTIFTPASSTFTTIQRNYSLTAAQINTAFGIGGFVNTTQDKAENPVFSFSFDQDKFEANSSGILLLVCPVDGPNMLPGVGTKKINTWRYVSGSPTNNPNSFDLWTDVIIGGKSNRICNWSTTPIPL